jgi:hypothetical protein
VSILDCAKKLCHSGRETFMRRYFVIALLCAGSVAAWPSNGHGQDSTPTGEIFIGGSKLWENAVGGPYHNHGVEVAVTGNFNRLLGLEMDLSEFGSPQAPAPAYGDHLRLLFGPHFAYNANARVSPFLHILGGLTRGRQCPATSACFLTSDELPGYASTAAVGVGLDVKVFRFVWLRPIQADYVRVFFPNAGENNLQLSFGFTFRFGSRGRTGNR